MTRCRTILLFAVSGLAALAGTPAADQAKVSPRVDALDLVLLGNSPARLELQVEVDGKKVPAVWDDTFAKLHAYCDRNGDGRLDKSEAGRLPSAFSLRQVLWGQFAPLAGDAPPFADLDLNRDGAVAGDELADFYRRAGLGGVLVAVGRPRATEQLTSALLKHFDANQDGRVDEAEWKAAPQALQKLDKNDDELIGPGELLEKLSYPGAFGATLHAAPSPGGKPDPDLDSLPLMVLPLRTGDLHWISAVADRRAKAKLPAIEPDAMSALRADAPAMVWNVRLGNRKPDAAPLQAAGGKSPADARLRFGMDGIRLELRADDGKLKEQAGGARKRFAALFAESDTDSDGALSGKEFAAPRAGQFSQMTAMADKNGDGNLSKEELSAWLDLQMQIAKGHVMVSVLDHGAGLFEFLDADHDGAVSVRELRTAWERLKASKCVTGKGFERTNLPRHLIAVVSHGHPQTAIGRPARGGPEWFQAMDRNGDGDVSRREFTGSAEVFDKFDLDKDGLLGAAEAGKAEVKK